MLSYCFKLIGDALKLSLLSPYEFAPKIHILHGICEQRQKLLSICACFCEFAENTLRTWNCEYSVLQFPDASAPIAPRLPARYL